MNIYVITIAGNRFYFIGDLSEQECKIIEQTCIQLSLEVEQFDTEEALNQLLKLLDHSILDKIKLSKIKYVFRI